MAGRLDDGEACARSRQSLTRDPGQGPGSRVAIEGPLLDLALVRVLGLVDVDSLDRHRRCESSLVAVPRQLGELATGEDAAAGGRRRRVDAVVESDLRVIERVGLIARARVVVALGHVHLDGAAVATVGLLCER